MKTRFHYLKVAIGCFAIGAIAASFIGCAPTKSAMRQAYDAEYIAFHQNTLPTDRSFDTTITVRIRAFANMDDLCAAWNWEFSYLGKCPTWNEGTHINTKPGQIWMIARQTKDGRLTVNDAVLGHEVLHELNQTIGTANPDVE